MDRIEKGLEEKIIYYTSLIIGVMTLIATLINIFLQLNIQLVIVVFIISAVYFSIFWYVKKRKANLFIKLFITLFSLVLINVVWYYNYFSFGPALGNFILLYAFLVFIWDRKRTILFASLVYLNIVGLMLYEYHHIDEMGNYPNASARVFDVYFGIILVIVVIHFFTAYAKSNFIKQFNKAKKSEELKSAFLANLSHEIRTPLNSIIGFSDLISSEDTSPEERVQYNSIIQSNSNDLLALIEDVVDLSMIESDEVKLVKSKFDLNGLLDSIYTEYTKGQKINKPIEISYEKLDPNITLFSDQLRVKQIIKNLLNNAIKYTSKGSIHFRFYAYHDKVVFSITDTGKGIKKEDMKVIFNRFMKLEHKSELYRGVGIGLHLSKRIALLLGGDIWVTSTYGKGSTFYFSLPR